MFRFRGENLRSVFILLFLYFVFFLLEHEDPAKYAQLFSFNADAVAAGELWRVFTFQFTQPGTGWLEALALFITMVLLYMLGAPLEEEWGTWNFLTLFAISTLTTAGVAAYLGIPLLRSYFVYFTLLFVYASAFPQQVFQVIPVRVRFLATFALAVLVYGAISGGAANQAALAGAVAGYFYYLSHRIRIRIVTTNDVVTEPDELPQVRIDTTPIQNAARFNAIKHAIATRNDADIERLLAQCERDVAQGVNICPPVDYKPEHADGYCVRCEGFAECSARYLRMNRPAASAPAPAGVAPVPAD